jgi:hypothetical protein
MADNVGYTPGSGALVASDEATYSGDTTKIQLMKPVLVTGTEGSKTVVELTGDATYGLDVDVTRLPALPAGTNAIGTVVVSDGTQTISIDAAQADGENNAANSLYTSSRNYVFNGTTWDRVRGDVTNGMDVDVTRVGGNVTVVQSTASSLNAQVVGSVANASADSGNPVKIGAQARITNRTAVTDGQRTDVVADDMGRLVVIQNQVRDLVTQATTTISTTTESTILAAGAAGVFHDLTLLVFTNTGNTATRVDVRDATAGTVRFSIWLPAAGGGAILQPPVPITATTAAANWTAQLSAATTDVRIFVQAVKNV